MTKWILGAMGLLLAWGCGGGESGEVREAHEVHSEASECGPGGCAHHGGHHGEGGEHECPCRRARAQAAAHHHEHEHEHEHGTGPVAEFHDALAPLWHAEHGAARTDGACNAVADFRAKAQAIQASAVPAGADDAAYRQAATGLASAVEDLGAACGEAGRPSFEARFEALHRAFHGVAERAHGE